MLRELISFERQRCEHKTLNSICLSSGLQHFTPKVLWSAAVLRACTVPWPTGTQAGNKSRRDPQRVRSLALPPGSTGLETLLPTQVGTCSRPFQPPPI